MIKRFLTVALLMVGACTGGASGDPDDDIGDIFILTHSPGNGETLRNEDSDDGFNALNNPTLRNPGAVTVVFTNSLDLSSVLDPNDLQQTRNVRLFYFDTSQGPFDPQQPTVPGVNPPGANVLIPATTTPTTTNVSNDTLIVRPTGITNQNPMPEGQYSLIVQVGVRGADGDGMKGQEYFFFFRVGDDNLGPVVVITDPAPGERDVEPDAEIRITMSETILAGTVNSTNIKVNFQPAGSNTPTAIPGFWYTDGGNGPGNNFPALQLDQNGNPGFTGVSPRNGVDLVFRPDITAFPVNMTAEDHFDPLCTLITDPPRKGNQGMPLGTAINVEFETIGLGVTDTAGNPVPAGSPNTKFTFQTRDLPDPIYAPNLNGAVYYGDTIGVGVIDVDPARTPYLVGPNPPRAPNSVVTTPGLSGQIVRVPVNDLVDINVDTRMAEAFYTFRCTPIPTPTLFMTTVYASSRSQGGGEVVIIDSFQMIPLGRFGTPSPGGLSITATDTVGRLAVSNFSANTITVFDIGTVGWQVDPQPGGFISQSSLQTAVSTGQAQLILREEDFERIFPAQRAESSSPPGPPILGTINVGIGPSKARITNYPQSLGLPGFPCFSPIGYVSTIVCSVNTGDNTASFAETTNLNQSFALEPELPGVNLASQASDVAYAPPIGPYYFFITSVAGSVEIFTTGFKTNQPSVRPDSVQNFAPNKIITSITGLKTPTAVQWITNGNGVGGYTLAALVAETGENRIQQLAMTALAPSQLFETINANLSSGLGPIDITGDPRTARPPSALLPPCGPRFQVYFVANAGEGTVGTSNYNGGIIGTTIPVPGVQIVTSWWSR